MDDLDPIVIMLSGGINSTVAASRALGSTDPHFVYFDHHHRAAQAELRAVRSLSQALAATLHIVKLPSATDILAADTAHHRADRSESSQGTGPASERPPGLMLTMFGLALQLAGRLNAGTIVCGASQVCDELESGASPNHGDPQTRHIFFHAALIALEMSLRPKRRIELDVPLIDMNRVDIVRAGQRIGAPLHLTWSCHLSGDHPCSKCRGCIARANAFAAIGLQDPVLEPARL